MYIQKVPCLPSLYVEGVSSDIKGGRERVGGRMLRFHFFTLSSGPSVSHSTKLVLSPSLPLIIPSQSHYSVYTYTWGFSCGVVSG